MVVIARFQWVGVVANTGTTQSNNQSDSTTTAAADETASSPRMQYFIQVVFFLYYISETWNHVENQYQFISVIIITIMDQPKLILSVSATVKTVVKTEYTHTVETESETKTLIPVSAITVAERMS